MIWFSSIFQYIINLWYLFCPSFIFLIHNRDLKRVHQYNLLHCKKLQQNIHTRTHTETVLATKIREIDQKNTINYYQREKCPLIICRVTFLLYIICNYNRQCFFISTTPFSFRLTRVVFAATDWKNWCTNLFRNHLTQLDWRRLFTKLWTDQYWHSNYYLAMPCSTRLERVYYNSSYWLHTNYLLLLC